MKITFERYDFAKGTVEPREREIDSGKVLAGNALMTLLKREAAKADPRRGGPAMDHEPTAKLFRDDDGR
jgi:hypothetical protein